jgi:GT2 family glycosyltransferase
MPDDTAVPLVTVLTPAYNVAKYIAEAVDSVLRQTFSDFEYIVLDDGSADDTVAVIRRHAGQDPRVRVIKGAHRGLCAVRNAGLSQARGRYVAFLDGDDRWHPRFLERQVALIESLPPDVGLVFCRSRMILENGTPVFVQWQRSGRYDFDDFLVLSNPARNGSSLLIRKSCFDEVGGFDDTVLTVEDLEMWLRIAERSSTPVLWGGKHFDVDYRLRPGSVTRDKSTGDLAILGLLESHAPRLRRMPPGLAYVRPAMTALKWGADDGVAEKMARRAREAGLGRLARSSYGWRLLFWSGLSPAGRRRVRSIQHSTREAVKSANLRIRGGRVR